MKLHNKIMNIECKELSNFSYKLGHRDARHAAAEMALKYDALIDLMEDHFGTGMIGIFKRKLGL